MLFLLYNDLRKIIFISVYDILNRHTSIVFTLNYYRPLSEHCFKFYLKYHFIRLSAIWRKGHRRTTPNVVVA